ncbi:hypothetical protein LCGC14_1980140, partial [marine sediment metagenome]
MKKKNRWQHRADKKNNMNYRTLSLRVDKSGRPSSLNEEERSVEVIA